MEFEPSQFGRKFLVSEILYNFPDLFCMLENGLLEISLALMMFMLFKAGAKDYLHARSYRKNGGINSADVLLRA